MSERTPTRPSSEREWPEATAYAVCPHGCDVGPCVFDSNPACREYPTPGGGFLCWRCGKWLYTVAAEQDERDATPKGNA